MRTVEPAQNSGPSGLRGLILVAGLRVLEITIPWGLLTYELVRP